MIPYGFPQSQILASICLYKSALGVQLDKIFKDQEITLSVYVDDIIISSNCMDVVKSVEEIVKSSAMKAGFEFNSLKQQGPGRQINSFNIDVNKYNLSVCDIRMNLFRSRISSASAEEIAGIHSYVSSINPAQIKFL